MLVVMNDFPFGLQMYVPMASKAFYRWVYQKSRNAPARTQAQIDSLNMIILFPGATDVMQNLPCQLGKALLFDPPKGSYEVRCTPTDNSPTNSSCSVINASKGSAPFGFGCGEPMATTIVWSDRTSYLEWHCFEGNIQVFNAVSINSTLTDDQISSMTTVLEGMGFNKKNFGYLPYKNASKGPLFDMLLSLLGIIG
jgi:hypothetical protein